MNEIMRKSTSHLSHHSLVHIILVSFLLMSGAFVHAQQQNAALNKLKAMSDYVGSQNTIKLTYYSDIEVITPELEKIQFSNSGGALLSRPNKLYAHRAGGYSEVELFFDGNTASVFAKSINEYAQFEGVNSLDELFDALRQGHGVALPAADLLLSQSYAVLIKDVMEAKYIGHGVIDGRECDHLAFRNFDTDWQLWIEIGPRPIPRKMVITSKTLNSAPQYTLRIKEWKADIKLSPDSFSFSPPAGAKKISADALIHFDELPQVSPPGENQ